MNEIQDIRQNLLKLGKQTNPSEIIETIRVVEAQIMALVEEAASVPTPKMKTQIKNFASSELGMGAYTETEDLANEWLDEHPEAEFLHMTSSQSADDESSEHCITLAVRVPVSL